MPSYRRNRYSRGGIANPELHFIPYPQKNWLDESNTFLNTELYYRDVKDFLAYWVCNDLTTFTVVIRLLPAINMPSHTATLCYCGLCTFMPKC